MSLDQDNDFRRVTLPHKTVLLSYSDGRSINCSYQIFAITVAPSEQMSPSRVDFIYDQIKHTARDVVTLINIIIDSMWYTFWVFQSPLKILIVPRSAPTGPTGCHLTVSRMIASTWQGKSVFKLREPVGSDYGIDFCLSRLPDTGVLHHR